ncbi:DUF2251 domain-containing protein [Ideonella sp. B7]|uniref:DUF2251 domain-containing protein n=1 Tax=Ideonella benzenivorans TaxID=2831643 RepID=UPI001CECA8FD|nr:DUF2251 domain-containing protein [Ideonella benzenivorans]MCA6215075.1 DUF2251 domain-containing protein [Ideonella benzenivorans]
MPVHVTAEQQLLVGTPLVVEGAAPEGRYVAVFEDDGETGYFYALDPSDEGNAIQDVLHIYNVASVTDRAMPSLVKIAWSVDSLRTVLLINGHPHAVFDFESKRGYCRSGFPPPSPNSAWASHNHEWVESAVELFA